MAVDGIGAGGSVNTADFYTSKAKSASETAAADAAAPVQGPVLVKLVVEQDTRLMRTALEIIL